jgi:hypothetical protein
MRSLAILYFVAVIVLLLLRPLAHAEEHRHGNEVLPDAVGRFYESWKMPYLPTSSCCNKADCYPVEAHMAHGIWYFRHRESGDWVPVPDKAIELNRDSPDSRNHVCASPGKNVFCFKSGGGT